MTETMLVSGIIGGIIGGMGMGGGTLLIPLLIAFCGFSQHTAQAFNLIAFVPMSVVSVIIHAKNKLIKPKYLLTVALPAVCVGVLASFLAINIKGEVLSKCFGWFLIVLGAAQLVSAFKQSDKKLRLPPEKKIIELNRNCAHNDK